MTTEQTAATSHKKKRHVPGRKILDRVSFNFSRHREDILPEKAYQLLLATERRIRGKPEKYNIGQLPLEPKAGFDPELYKQHDVLALEDSGEEIALGVPYIARGTIWIDEGNAILDTTSGSINLGPLGPHAERLLSKQLQGEKMVVPVVIDKIGEEEIWGRAGTHAAYLNENPTWLQRQRLAWRDGQARFTGRVAEVDTKESGQIVVETPRGRRGRPSEITLALDEGSPVFDQGTTTRPTTGEPVAVGDQVIITGKFTGRRLSMTGPAVLLDFSPEHHNSYEERRGELAERLHTLELVLTDETTTSVKQGDKEWHLINQEARETVARYLFAQLRKEQHLLLPTEQERMWELIDAMDPHAQPVVFADDDTRHTALESYFAKMDKKSKMPRLTESMTPAQLLDEMRMIAALDDYPPSLEIMMDIVHDYEEQLGTGAALTLLQGVLVYREEQLVKGENPLSAIFSLSEALPYLQELDVSHQAYWLAHLIHAGGLRYQSSPTAWKDSTTDLYQFMKTCLSKLESVVYGDNADDKTNTQALITLFPYYHDHLSLWSASLPYELGQEKVIDNILGDLSLIHAGRVWQEALGVATAEPLAIEDSPSDGLKEDLLVG